jgi:hypothetical protein
MLQSLPIEIICIFLKTIRTGGTDMKKTLRGAIIPLIAVGVLFGCRDVTSPLGPSNAGGRLPKSVTGSVAASDYGQAVNLIAGRNTVIGSVRCWIKGDSLHIRYSTDGGWVLTATQLIVVKSLQDIPLAADKNPKIGHFPLKQEHVPPVSECQYSLNTGDCGLNGVDNLVIAAHAETQLVSGDGRVEREEGAWAEGEPFSAPKPDHHDGSDTAGHSKGDITIESSQGAPKPWGNWAMYFTVDVYRITVSELKINEVYFAGSCASSFYFYDQFVELYNASDDTLYLDGIILTRQSQTVSADQEDINYVRAIYAFQFPGTPLTGRQYPIAPGQHVVIASDAIDHSAYCPNAVDLSEADYECYTALGSDYDNPLVPNLVSINPTSSADYLLNLVHNGVVIATGAEYSLEEYAPGKAYVVIPIRTIIDGVEYSSTADAQKQLTVRVDTGFAGIGCVRYSGQSTERKEPGFDTNNSTFDFVVLPHATPGY